jgi:hypothetical protein
MFFIFLQNMQSSAYALQNINPIMSLAARKAFLRPLQLSQNVTQVAWKSRGPRRYLGYTRSQVLDTLMRTNANTCFYVCLTSFPMAAYMIYRYKYVLKPGKLEYEKQKEAELLAEGAFEKS